MADERTPNFYLVKIRAQDLADAAILLHWSGDRQSNYARERYGEARAALIRVLDDIAGFEGSERMEADGAS